MALFIANQTRDGGDVQMRRQEWVDVIARLTAIRNRALARALAGLLAQRPDGDPVRLPLTTEQIRALATAVDR